MEKEKKILVWDGIFQGHKYITEKEMKDRKVLQKEMSSNIYKFILWALGIFVGFIILMFLL